MNLIARPRLSLINKKIGGKHEASFDIPFMILSHAESIKTILGVLLDPPAITSTANLAMLYEIGLD